MKYWKKKTTLTASRRIDKCPTPRQGFSTNSPPPRPGNMTNARKMPRGMATLRIDWVITKENRKKHFSRNLSKLGVARRWIALDISGMRGCEKHYSPFLIRTKKKEFSFCDTVPWISNKLLSDAAFTWRLRELSGQKKYHIWGDCAIWTIIVLEKVSL